MAWCSIPHDLWVGIRDALPRPWPDEAVEADLCWWTEEAARLASGRPGQAAPGRRVLAARWGWGPDDRKTKAAVQRLAAYLEARPAADPPAAQRRPAADAGGDTVVQGLARKAQEKPAFDRGAVSDADAASTSSRPASDPRVTHPRPASDLHGTRELALNHAARPASDPPLTHAWPASDPPSEDPVFLSPRARALSPRAFYLDPDPDPGSGSLSRRAEGSAKVVQESSGANLGPGGPAAGGGGKALGAVWAHARRYEPRLPERHRGALEVGLSDEDPALLCLVLDWAYRSPDPEAARLRREAAGPGYILVGFRLAERIVRARRWAEAGRPLAVDALLLEGEAQAAEAAHLARLRAEDAARWPGWTPPPSFRGLAREYMALGRQATVAAAMARDQGSLSDVGISLLADLSAKGWDPNHPLPADPPAQREPALAAGAWPMAPAAERSNATPDPHSAPNTALDGSARPTRRRRNQHSGGRGPLSAGEAAFEAMAWPTVATEGRAGNGDHVEGEA